jgi:ribosomal protein L12E/L44/L45/RPP1/RPP2
MSPDILAIVIATTVQLLSLIFLAWDLSRMLRKIGSEVTQVIAAITFNVLQGRRIEEVLREIREPLRDTHISPA